MSSSAQLAPVPQYHSVTPFQPSTSNNPIHCSSSNLATYMYTNIQYSATQRNFLCAT